MFLRFGLLFVEDPLQLEARRSVLALNLLEVQISNLFSRQKEVVLVLAIKPN